MNVRKAAAIRPRRRCGLGAVAVATAASLLVGLVVMRSGPTPGDTSATAAMAATAATTSGCDRGLAVAALQMGGSEVRHGAEAALVGSDDQVCQFLTASWPDQAKVDNRTRAERLAKGGGPVVRSAAKRALDSTDPTAIGTFLDTGWQGPASTDKRVRVNRIIATGGPKLRAAAQQALDASTVDDFLDTGWRQPWELDQRIKVNQILAVGGPEVQRVAQRALDVDTVDALLDFLANEWPVASVRDQETATIDELSLAADAARVEAAVETQAAQEQADRAVVASAQARQKAQDAAAAGARAQGNAAVASEAASIATEAANGAAEAARQAVTAANAASAAARDAANAAARAASVVAKAEQAAARAQESATAAEGDASLAQAARDAAQQARSTGLKAHSVKDAADQAGIAADRAQTAAAAATGASGNAQAAIDAANEAIGYAESAAVDTAKARQAAARAQANTNRAVRAAQAANQFAGIAAGAAYTARDAANRAATDADDAATAATEAADHAGEATGAAQRSTDHANAATQAAQAAVDAVNQAQVVYDAARTAEDERLAVLNEQGFEQAHDAVDEMDRRQQLVAWDAEQAARHSDETNQLMALVTTPGTARPDAVTAARKVALAVATTGGPWTRGAALAALTGSDDQALDLVRTGIGVAGGQDDRVTLRNLEAAGSDAMKAAADTALAGSDADVAQFLRTRDYPERVTEERAGANQVLTAAQTAAQPALVRAAQRALAAPGPQAVRDFLASGQYTAAAVDERIAINRVLAIPGIGPELTSAAQIALEAPPAAAHQFLVTGQFQAAQRDQDAASHRAVVASVLAHATQMATEAMEDAQTAQASAATARGAAAEAQSWADQAAGSATQAAASATQAQQSATEAESSAAQAATSAQTAADAANTASAALQRAARSANWARSSSMQASGYATQAYNAAMTAFNTATAAGQDADAAITAFHEATDHAVQKANDERLAAAFQRATECSVFQNVDPERFADCMGMVTHPGATLIHNGETCAQLNPPDSPQYKNCIHDAASPTFELDQFNNSVLPVLLLTTGALMIQLTIAVGAVTALACNAVCGLVLALTQPELVAGGMLDTMLVELSYGLGASASIRTGSVLEEAFVESETELAAFARLAETLPACVTGNSFTADTPVRLADGTSRPIGDIRTGDRVTATDPLTGATDDQPVTATITGTGDKDLVEVTVDTDGASGSATGTVTATANHPFWLPDAERWSPADELHPGQWLRTSSGTWVQITAASRRTEHTTVHNLTVADYHTYYVVAGDAPVLVHNGPPCLNPEIPYNYYRSELAQKAYLARLSAPGSHFPSGPWVKSPGGNIAVARVRVTSMHGSVEVDEGEELLYGYSLGGSSGYHSEIDIKNQIDQLRTDNPDRTYTITELYSERQVCTDCNAALQGYLAPDAEVTWSVPWIDNARQNADANELLARFIRLQSNGTF